MFFDYLNPFHWIRTILGLILLIILILIPGWKVVFAQKTLSEIGEMFSSNFWGTIGKVFSEAFAYYKNWFQSKETQEKIEKTKGKMIETLEKRVKGEPVGESNESE